MSCTYSSECVEDLFFPKVGDEPIAYMTLFTPESFTKPEFILINHQPYSISFNPIESFLLFFLFEIQYPSKKDVNVMEEFE